MFHLGVLINVIINGVGGCSVLWVAREMCHYSEFYRKASNTRQGIVKMLIGKLIATPLINVSIQLM